MRHVDVIQDGDYRKSEESSWILIFVERQSIVFANGMNMENEREVRDGLNNWNNGGAIF